MKWYHFTSFGRLCDIIRDEALLSRYEQLILACKGDPQLIEGVKRMAEEIRLTDQTEYNRNANIFLASSPEPLNGAFSYNIRLRFELNEQPNFGKHLILPKVSIDELEEIAAKPANAHTVKKLLREEHNGKYSGLPVIMFNCEQ